MRQTYEMFMDTLKQRNAAYLASIPTCPTCQKSYAEIPCGPCVPVHADMRMAWLPNTSDVERNSQ